MSTGLTRAFSDAFAIGHAYVNPGNEKAVDYTTGVVPDRCYFRIDGMPCFKTRAEHFAALKLVGPGTDSIIATMRQLPRAQLARIIAAGTIALEDAGLFCARCESGVGTDHRLACSNGDGVVEDFDCFDAGTTIDRAIAEMRGRR